METLSLLFKYYIHLIYISKLQRLVKHVYNKIKYIIYFVFKRF